MDRKYAFPRTISSLDVKAVRESFNMTQKEFAATLGVSKPTVERWEHSDKPIGGVEALLFDILKEHPELLNDKRLVDRKYPLRLEYMYGDKVCAAIDVDERKRLVKVTNYSNLLDYRPFGTVTEPTYEQYEEFLESRCFPRSRDKMKLQLDALGIPFYDPIMIIEKTKGRMAEDDFWINIVR